MLLILILIIDATNIDIAASDIDIDIDTDEPSPVKDWQLFQSESHLLQARAHVSEQTKSPIWNDHNYSLLSNFDWHDHVSCVGALCRRMVGAGLITLVYSAVSYAER